MTTGLRAVAALGIVMLLGVAFGQEYNPDWLERDLRSADLVAVGTLTGVWTYPWLDGWHRRGTIHIEKALRQSRSFGSDVTLTWDRSYGVSFDRDWAKFEGKRGIWILREYTTTWDDRMIWCGNGMEGVKKATSMKALKTLGFAGGFLALEKQDAIVELIARTRRN